LVVTQCPECHALFRVSEGQMRLAQGQVRCGACLTVFDAQSHALQPVGQTQTRSQSSATTPNAPQQSAQPEPLGSASLADSTARSNYATQGANARVVQFNQNPASEAAPAPTIPAARSAPGSQPTPNTQAPPQQQPKPAIDPALIPQIDILAEPIVLHNNEPRDANPVAVLFWTLCSMLALAGLLGQYLWFERATLANQSALTPFYQIACERVRCDLNANQGLANLKPDQVVARPHQQFTDLISLAIRIRNEAAFAQPYPAIEVSFTDLKGNLVSRRTFQPGQYLGTNTEGAARLPAGLDIEVNLPLTTPGPEAVSYEIRLHSAKS